MLKKVIKVSGVLILVGFSFFYTEKVTKIAREKDPIMIEIRNVKDGLTVSSVDPIINDDEYIMGINGCKIDVEESFSKMKNVGEFKEELLVMSEIKNKEKLTDKYIISGNKILKNTSIIFLVRDDISDNLLNYLSSKGVSANFFIDGEFLEKDLITTKFIAEKNNIYYYGNDGKYDDEYMLYNNNLISLNGKNESNFCLLEKKNKDVLNLCSDYEMKTIKAEFIKENIYTKVKENLSNGSIIVLDTNDIEEVKASINYIISSGYNIVTLDKLLDESNKCK